LLPGRGVPEDDGAISSARGHRLAVRGEDDRPDGAAVATHLMKLLVRLQIKQVDASAVTACGEFLAIRAEVNTGQVAVEWAELEQLLRRGNIPQANRPVPGAACQDLAVVADVDRRHLAFMAGETADEGALDRFPEMDLVVSPARGDILAIRCEGEARVRA